jgi:hypothetical protein
MAMMAMTTCSSINVKPRGHWSGGGLNEPSVGEMVFIHWTDPLQTKC